MRHFLTAFIPLALVAVLAVLLYAPYDWGSEVYERELQAVRAISSDSKLTAKRNEERLATTRLQYPYRERAWLWEDARRSGEKGEQRQLAVGQCVAELLLLLAISSLIGFGYSFLVGRRKANQAINLVRRENMGLRRIILRMWANPEFAEQIQIVIEDTIRTRPADSLPLKYLDEAVGQWGKAEDITRPDSLLEEYVGYLMKFQDQAVK